MVNLNAPVFIFTIELEGNGHDADPYFKGSLVRALTEEEARRLLKKEYGDNLLDILSCRKTYPAEIFSGRPKVII